MTLLHSLAERAVDGQTIVVNLRGGPGSGKSRLARALLQSWEDHKVRVEEADELLDVQASMRARLQRLQQQVPTMTPTVPSLKRSWKISSLGCQGHGTAIRKFIASERV